MVEVGGHLNDQELLDLFVREVTRMVPALSAYGVPLGVADGSHYHLANYPKGPQPNLPGIYNVQTSPGRPLSFNLTLPLRETAERMGVRILDNVIATRILSVENCAAGAVALNLQDGALLAVSSKTVVMATGGSSRIYERTDNPVDLTGEGFSLAFDAGADLVNMELVLINPLKMTDDVLEMLKTGKPSEKVLAVGRAHYNLGGIMTELSGESTLSNLYAAGEVADGMLGAGRLGGTALGHVVVLGTIAGRESGARAGRMSRNDNIERLVTEERERLEELTRGGDASPAEVQKEVKSAMWKLAGPAKDEESLSRAAEKLAELKNVSMKVAAGDPRETAQAVEAHAMARVGELIVISSLQRRETRGQFWRLDYPQPDNDNCFFNVVLSRRGKSVEIRKKPLTMTRMREPSGNPLVGSGCSNYLRPPEEG
jgi:succinate dehydrogenase/fumarate reductase flavoprotein subunit